MSIFLSFILITSGSSIVQPAQSQSQQQPYPSTEDVLNDLFPNFDQQLQEGSEAVEYFNKQFEEQLPGGTPCTPSTPCEPVAEPPTHIEQVSTQSSSESSSICIQDPVVCAQQSCLKDMEGNNIRCLDNDITCPEVPGWRPGLACPDSTMESESLPDEEGIPAEDVCSEDPSGSSSESEPIVYNIPIDPGNGGRSIDTSALQIGDIILSTTNKKFSGLIRDMTDSPVSHTILYVGNGQVIESVGEGVRLVPIETALSDASFAVAARYPGLTHDQALQIRDFAGKQLGKSFDEWGLVKQAKFRIYMDPALALGLALCPDVDPELFRNALATINLGTGTNNEWFCSELVVASFAAAGVPLTTTPPHWTAPGDIVPLILNENLEYVGHLIIP